MLKKALFSFILCATTFLHTEAQNALHFDGVNDYVQTTYSGISGTNSRTVEAWIKVPNTTLPMDGAIVSWGANLASQKSTFRVQSGIGTNGAIRYEVNGGYVIGSTDLRDGLWHHVAVTWANDGTPSVTDAKLYVDGVQETLSAQLGWAVNTSSANALTIGKKLSNTTRFEGEIDELRIWNVARTATEIASNMNAEFCVIPSSLKAYYKFNQGVASGTNTGLTTLNDNSGNNNTGTLTSFSLSGSTSNWVTGAALSQGNLVGGTTSISGCVPYTTLGNQVLTTSGTYPDTLVMSSGCDSSYTINFTALPSSTSTITTTECDYYFSPGGGVLDSTGVYHDTLVNAIGCDSIITINLTINNTTGSNITTTSCNSYTSPAGNVYTTSGTYVDTFQNSMSCDSLITINLTIIDGYYITLNENGCDSYTSPSGKTWTTSGTYLDTIPTGTGCDSLYTIHLTMNQSSANTITETACDEYYSSNGNTYNTSGTYTEIISNSSGCDSVITLNITIINIDTTVTSTGFTLTAAAAGLTYRWLDCNDNYAPISGGNQQSFTPSLNGDYAVKIRDGNCVDTSTCVSVTKVGVDNLNQTSHLKVYPNPAKGSLFINNTGEKTTVSIFTVSGKIIEVIQVQNGIQQYDVSNLSSGIYMLKYSSNNGSFVEKLVVE